MGYESNFHLRVIGGDKEERKNVIDKIERVSGYTFDSKGDESADVYDVHWYEYGEDIIKVAKKYPDVVIEVLRQGENRDDNTLTRYRGSEMEMIEEQHVWPPFERLRLPEDAPDEILTLRVKIKKSSAGNLCPVPVRGDELLESASQLFDFAYREEPGRWLFWLRGDLNPISFKGAAFPMDYFLDACRARHFLFYGGRIPDNVEILEGEELIQKKLRDGEL